MPDDETAAQERHRRFIARVAATHELWGLKCADGWCISPSDNAGNKGREVMPFWSDRGYAAQCAKDDWAMYEPTAIQLDAFLESWLPGMAGEGLLAGTDWNPHLDGMEIEPLKLKEELEQALRAGAA